MACGYRRILGIDFNEGFSPVINNISCQIMLIAKLIWNLEASIADVETAVLHFELQEEIYMSNSEGMSYDSKHYLLLTKTIYDLIQSAREFSKRLISTVKFIRFHDNKSDTCLILKWTQDGVMMTGIYVENFLVIGMLDGIAELIVELKKNVFNLKVENNLTSYLRWWLIEAQNQMKYWYLNLI
jgi:hypothetical protein